MRRRETTGKAKQKRREDKRETRLPVETDKSVDTVSKLPLSPVEREIIRLAHVERADPTEIAETLELAGHGSWTVERVGRALERARAKLIRAGELEQARPSAYALEDCRMRYDSIVRKMRRDIDEMPTGPEFARVRAELLRSLASVEKMRDDALLALSGKAAGQGPGIVAYVSHLTTGTPNASAGDSIPAQAE